ncbi:MAG: hypothetical protein ACLQDM_27515 [Bradyrhizobium sp.]
MDSANTLSTVRLPLLEKSEKAYFACTGDKLPILFFRRGLCECIGEVDSDRLDGKVVDKPGDLVVYGGTGRAARDWASYHAIAYSRIACRV